MIKVIDLRSDTSSLPTEEMIHAVRNARLGNDGFREDPTVNALEDLAAKKLGKEAALLVPSGTQGNLVVLLTCERSGKGLVIEERGHIIMNEGDGYSKVAGLIPILVKGDRGLMNPGDVKKAIDNSNAEPGILVIENTHTYAGGSILPVSGTRELCELGHEKDTIVHLDGSRIFHASVALGIDPKDLVEGMDTMMFCLSKGLCCPIGSMILGTEDFIQRARPYRKLLGGQMRQAGIIAAAGIVALEKMVDRLKEDHENAKTLAKGLSRIEGVKIDPSEFQTNIVHFEVPAVRPDFFLGRMKERGVLMHLMKGSSTIRGVTYRNITREDIHYVLQVVEEVLTRKEPIPVR